MCPGQGMDTVQDGLAQNIIVTKAVVCIILSVG